MMQQTLRHYRRQLEKFDEQIQQLIAEDEQFQARAELLKSVPGIGPATIGVLLAELVNGLPIVYLRDSFMA